MDKRHNWKKKKRKIIFLEPEQIIKLEALKWEMKAESIYEVYSDLLEIGYKSYTRKEAKNDRSRDTS